MQDRVIDTFEIRTLAASLPEQGNHGASPPPHVFLLSNSPHREASLRLVLGDFGMPISFDRMNGLDDEDGYSPVARAVDKVFRAAARLSSDPHIVRNAGLVVLVAADSRNIDPVTGTWRDKPNEFPSETAALQQWQEYGEEWRRYAKDAVTVPTRSGYAALAVAAGRPTQLVTAESSLTTVPPSLHILQHVFDADAMFEQGRKCAHGLPSKELLKDGALRLLTLQGTVLVGQPAIDALYGASEEIFADLLTQALSVSTT